MSLQVQCLGGDIKGYAHRGSEEDPRGPLAITIGWATQPANRHELPGAEQIFMTAVRELGCCQQDAHVPVGNWPAGDLVEVLDPMDLKLWPSCHVHGQNGTGLEVGGR
jgi:hypothetical protein